MVRAHSFIAALVLAMLFVVILPGAAQARTDLTTDWSDSASVGRWVFNQTSSYFNVSGGELVVTALPGNSQNNVYLDLSSDPLTGNFSLRVPFTPVSSTDGGYETQINFGFGTYLDELEGASTINCVTSDVSNCTRLTLGASSNGVIQGYVGERVSWGGGTDSDSVSNLQGLTLNTQYYLEYNRTENEYITSVYSNNGYTTLVNRTRLHAAEHIPEFNYLVIHGRNDGTTPTVNFKFGNIEDLLYEAPGPNTQGQAIVQHNATENTKKNSMVRFDLFGWFTGDGNIDTATFSYNDTGTWVNDTPVSGFDAVVTLDNLSAWGNVSGETTVQDAFNGVDGDVSTGTYCADWDNGLDGGTGTCYLHENVSVFFQNYTSLNWTYTEANSSNYHAVGINAWNYTGNTWQGVGQVVYVDNGTKRNGTFSIHPDFLQDALFQVRMHLNIEAIGTLCAGSCPDKSVFYEGWLAATLNTSRAGFVQVEREVTAIRGQEVCGQVTFNSTDGVEVTNLSCFVVANTLPVLENVTLPLVNESQNATLLFNVSDVDQDTLTNHSKWFVNGEENQTLENVFVLEPGTLSAGTLVIASVRVSDGVDNTSWQNTTEVSIGDLTPPYFTYYTFSTSSVPIDSQITFTVNLTDQASNLTSVLVELEDANGLFQNYSMSLFAGNNTGGEDQQWSRTFTATSPVGVWYGRFYATDFNGNQNRTIARQFNFTVGGGGGGGGGGGVAQGDTVIISGNVSAELVYSVGDPYSFILLYTPSTREKNIRVSNIGNGNFVGTIDVSQSIKEYVRVETCDLVTQLCSTAGSITIPQGQSIQVNLVLDAPAGSLREPTEGLVRFVSEQKSFELGLLIERVPALSWIQLKLVDAFSGLSEQNAFYLTFAIIIFAVILISLAVTRLG